ncbi:hypothetical protein CANINC_003295 [Pichia inconspicua]|uniref:CBM21 domain-containing protein n=1 Tax=Pichia inconspicua TaxID=52247 RepID=A0A4T0X047_9ASCO|nr:hypothetical protein CANINC_003295 [[Candida] inconspicua]
MPYLGPQSFKTTPLTSSNLAVLDNSDNHFNITDQSHNIKNNITTPVIDLQLSQFQNSQQSQLNCNLQKLASSNSPLKSSSMQTLSSSSNQLYRPLNYLVKSPSSSSTSNHLTNTETIITNSTCSSNSCKDSLVSSETSYTENISNDNNSTTESYSHKTLVDVNDDDNKTVILSANDDNNLLIPPSPLKAYNVVSVSPKTSRLHRQLFQQSHDDHNLLNSPPSQQLQFIHDQPSPLMRKKSGELIKSSLKLNNLQRSNSMPNAKTVRFATRLENVKFFKKSEHPSAVSVQPPPTSKLAVKSTKWDFDSSSCSSSENDDDDNLGSLIYKGGINYVDDDSYYITEDNDTQTELLNELDDAKNDWIIKFNDCPHNPDSLNFARLASNRDVILESIKLNSTGNALIGFVYANNIAFEKNIIVRLTTDHWKSFKEFDNANYISSNHIFKYSDAHSNVYDKFSFIIKLDDLTFDDSLDVEFCIQYNTNNQTFWDNNNGNNYKVSLIRRALKNSKQKLDSTSLKTSFDLDDSNIKLKDNNNFKLDFSKPKTDINSLRTSNSFGLKKIKSESSLPLACKSSYSLYNLDFSSSSAYNNFGNNNNNTNNSYNSYTRSSPKSINEFTSLSTTNNKSQFAIKQSSKSLSASPALSSSGFDHYNGISDYDNIIKKFCFFTTSDHSAHKDDDSASSIHSDHSENRSENNNNLIKSQFTTDNFNYSKSQTSIDLY